MKLFMRLAVLGGLGFLLFSSSNHLVDIFYTNNVFVESTTQLISVASIIGFLLFIVFTYFVEYAELRYLNYYHKLLSSWINVSYLVLSITALVITIVYFDFRKAIVIAIVYLMITIAYDYLRERIIFSNDKHHTHPKTII